MRPNLRTKIKGSLEHVIYYILEQKMEYERMTIIKPKLKVLIACECSGIVRDAFLAKGHNAISCDLLPTKSPGPHIQGDVLDILDDGWDLMIAHPPCTYLASSGLHWNKRIPGREEKTKEALEFVKKLMEAPIPKICIENPVGKIGTAIRPADQYIQPYEFGHNASKKTGLWLKNLPLLKPTGPFIKPRYVNGKPRWGNQTDSGQNKLGPSKNRWYKRSKFYKGWAKAMAEQWG